MQTRRAPSRPVILQIIPELDTGGAELSTIEAAEAIVKGGGRALVASQGGRLADRLRAAGGELIPFPAATKNPTAIFWNARRLERILRAQGVDLVHARSRAPAWTALMAARKMATPFVTTYHGAYSEKSPLKRRYNSVMAKGDLVIANSRFTAELIRSRYGTPEARLRIVYRGVSKAEFDPSGVSGRRVAAVRESFGVAPGERIVLQPARLSHWKGQRDMIAAAARMADTPDAVFVLAGDAQGRDGYVAELRRRIADLGAGERVRLTGHCADMPAAYAAAHVAVVASTQPEAFGRVAIEAQAMGCPVIATNIGATPETVRTEPQKATGWLVPPADPPALERALRVALSLAPGEREAMGRRARENASSFSIENMQAGTLGVYDELLGSSLVRRYREGAGARLET